MRLGSKQLVFNFSSVTIKNAEPELSNSHISHFFRRHKASADHKTLVLRITVMFM